ncbi:M12 family metallopeptidase [Pseudoduganella lutea]|uniref:Peptidase metallopeptidase domain-containing protein n=1 Tax=Pseudoduganella lutea TaxID=321985 RepID=A0A4V0Z470_9BURK|nr:M12 family metallopeptidase [Pseudoduganella lutea]QBE65913.1 hypothetical protein EWM63_25440 [Pseudoduganella lutea]
MSVLTKNTVNERRYCSQPRREPPKQISALGDQTKTFAIITSRKKWTAGTNLTYFCFSDRSENGPDIWRGSDSDIAVVQSAFERWMALGLGISFSKVDSPLEAVLRIGFQQGDGSWSLVGTDNRTEKDHGKRTMNFGWALDNSYGEDTALHEIGHAIGLEHEHQNMNAGIEWNETAVMEYFRGEPNFWKDKDIEWNVLRKLSKADTNGSAWDPNSIMEYWFEPGLINKPEPYADGLRPAGGLSSQDIEWAETWFPRGHHAELTLGKSKQLELAVGETTSFSFTPHKSGSYTVYTIGQSDSTLVLFEKTPQGNTQIAADEDSGQERNAQIKADLKSGMEYVIGVRLHYKTESQTLRLIIDES